ncbi:2'-5' RNA ligase family protein [Candidatus Saccharibacteria bacterium]|nr:2'-5' RNA ligase family protein [Candidatus Saccharibacteria bacterium]
MKKYSQKWTIVTFLEPVKDSYEFNWRNWPLHITLADTFSINWEKNDCMTKLEKLLAIQKPIKVSAKNIQLFGEPNKKHYVVVLERNTELVSLHNDIIALLKNSGAIFNEPQFIKEGFIPHIAIKDRKNYSQLDLICVSESTIVDMFPNGDGEQRKILKTVKFARI